MPAIGEPLRRVEDPRLVAGRGRYVEDVQPVGALHLAFVRAPYAKARISHVETSAARAMDGVAAVLTSQDVQNLGHMPVPSFPFARLPPNPLLARGSVATFGQPVAVVAADTAAQARDAADLVEVDYEPETPVVSAEAALAPDAPRVYPELDSNVCYRLTRGGGDVEQALREADVVARVKVTNQRLAPIALEPRGVVCVPEALGE